MERINKVLIVDDEKDILKVLRLFLEKENLIVYEACDGEAAYELFKKQDIDLVLLDIMMPKVDGYELIKKIRLEKDTPIVVISAKVQLQDRVLGLDIGADDYIVKPFEPLEVVARVKAQLRRINKNDKDDKQELLRCGDMLLDKEKCKVIISEKAIDLTKRELSILECLMKRAGKVFTRDELYELAWSDDSDGVDDNTIRVTISRIREKIGNERIKTIRGLGYRLEKNE